MFGVEEFGTVAHDGHLTQLSDHEVLLLIFGGERGILGILATGLLGLLCLGLNIGFGRRE